MVRTTDKAGPCEALEGTAGTLAFTLRSEHSSLQVEARPHPGKTQWRLWPGGPWFVSSFSKALC